MRDAVVINLVHRKEKSLPVLRKQTPIWQRKEDFKKFTGPIFLLLLVAAFFKYQLAREFAVGYIIGIIFCLSYLLFLTAAQIHTWWCRLSDRRELLNHITAMDGVGETISCSEEGISFDKPNEFEFVQWAGISYAAITNDLILLNTSESQQHFVLAVELCDSDYAAIMNYIKEKVGIADLIKHELN